MTMFDPIQMGKTQQLVTSLVDVETLLDCGMLQMLSHNGKWYNIRRNGATKRWKREPMRAEIPCKVGFRECFRLTFNPYGVCYEFLRERPGGVMLCGAY